MADQTPAPTSAGAPNTSCPAPVKANKSTKSTKRDEPPVDDLCAICQDAMQAVGEGLFLGPCGHKFHVQCAEQAFVIGHKRNCPLCRAPFKHAPGFIALAKAQASLRSTPTAHQQPLSRSQFDFGYTPHRSSGFTALPDVPLPQGASIAAANAAAAALMPDFARATVQTDVMWLPAGRTTEISALVTIKFKDDDDAAPVTLASDYVLLVDISGSMAGSKLASVKDALLKMSEESFFESNDRVALVTFDNVATQVTPMARLSDPDNNAAFRRAVMCLADRGGTDISRALAAAEVIIAGRTAGASNPGVQVCLMSDGQDHGAREAPLPGHGACLCTMGFGADHDADLLASLANRSQPRGTFTFVESDDKIDESLAAWQGDVSRVLTHSAKLVVNPTPGSGVRVTGAVNAPGVVQMTANGGITVELGAARVDAKMDVLLTLQVPAREDGSNFEALSLLVEGATTQASQVVQTLPLVISFEANTAAAPPAPGADAIAEAHNMERLALASAAVATASTAQEAADVVAAARTMLGGTPAARATVEAQLTELAADAQRMETVRARAAQMAHATTAQRAATPAGRMGSSKGATGKATRMVCRKSGGYY